ncbi:hypothetical protein [Marinomonas sp. BSi20584]|uniref:hypothetical protein n=1 Tax=Marinomonas sp. BSi20584 TaxID=1594462 RepID=UPI000C1F6B58|nr:hypothetical protein [Marinomonas sp. BSi20584]PJE57197.1 hypothetical protein TY87_00550 [Marinomonas sp. BSi20584]
MDSFLFFWGMYKRASFWRVLRDGYRPDGRTNIGLLTYSTLLLVFLIVHAFRNRNFYIYIDFLLIGLWVFWLWKSIKRAYRHYEEQYASRLEYYKQERQYLRYLIFRDEVIRDNISHGISISDALAHIETDLDTEVTDVLKTSIFITTGLSVVITLTVNLIGKWDTSYTLLVLFVSAITLLIGISILGSVRSRKVKLLELKRYLTWLQREEALTRATE